MSEMMTNDNNEGKEMITLIGKDSVNIQIPLNIAKMSVTIKNLLEDFNDEGNIPISVVNGSILQKIFEFCNHIHTNQEDFNNVKAWIDDKSFTLPLSQWFDDYMNVDQQTMFDIILGANFLDIQLLLNMNCKYIAGIIRNKTPEELRTYFGTSQTTEVPPEIETTDVSPETEAT